MSTPSFATTTDFLNALPKPETEEQYRALFDAMNEEMIRIEKRMEARDAVYAALEARSRASQTAIDANIKWLKESFNVG